jgi:phosphogluconate dehydratase
VIKISSAPPDRRRIDARLRCSTARRSSRRIKGKLEAMSSPRHSRPRANGMPELHSLTPALTALQNKGFRVAR